MSMTAPEVRELVIVVGLLTLIAVMMILRRPPAIPPVVAPLTMPVEEQVRDVRHRVANVEQKAMSIDDHAARLRIVEREMGEVRGSLSELKNGQARIERNLEMLVDHQMHRERDK